MSRACPPLAAALGVCMGLGAAIQPAHGGARNYAVIVGNREPPVGKAGDTLKTLRYSDDDAVRYHTLFSRLPGGTRLLTVLDPDTRRRHPDVPIDGAPSLVALRGAVSEIADEARVARHDGHVVRFYFVFSGHGAINPAGEAYLALLDGGITQQWLFDEVVREVSADEAHLIIDACHAAGVVGVRGESDFSVEIDATTRAVSPADTQQWLERRTLAQFPHVGVMVAASAGAQAHEWSEIEAGVFSHEVLSGLWGAADVNSDLRVEYSELQAFIASANRRLADPRAVPQVVARAPAAVPHAVLVDLADLRDAQWVTGDARELGRFHIELGNGERHLDAHLAVPTVSLALPASADAYLRTDAGEAGLPGPTVRFEELPLVPLTATARGSQAQTYREGLFLDPFTVDYYRGHVDSSGGVPVVFAPPRPKITKPEIQLRPINVDVPAPAPAPRPALSVPDQPDPGLRARNGGATMAAIASGSGISALVLGGLAGKAHTDFKATAIEKEAHDFRARHRSLTIAAVTTGVVSAVSWAIAAGLLARAKRLRDGRRRAK